ncbi:MAG TPA: hypothetical protein VKT72_11880 [Candidatus Baltobacteraceae bacterium]|nr:hypothetical protein [Candidatus Baltobacteraceae bacterium]
MTYAKRSIAALSLAALIVSQGCGGGAAGAPPVNSVNPTSPSYSSLQFAVGTANLYGNAQIGLNVVSTLRQPSGASADGAMTPTITGPFKIVAAAAPSGSGFADPYTTIVDNGPSFREAGGASIGGTPQTVAAGTPACDGTSVPAGFVACPSGLSPNTSSFGQSGGVFAMGLLPSNAVAETGQGYSYQPYAQPFYSAGDATTTYQFIPWGGPPAFDPDGNGMGERDGLSINGVDSFGDPYFLGVGEGITAFDGVTPSSGAYKLSVAISTIGNGGAVSTSTIAKTAQLNASVVLPTLTAPVFTPDGKGGGSFTVSLPAGVTEAYVQIVDFGPGGGPNDGGAANVGNCQGPRGTSFAPVYYTVHVAASGAYNLPDMDGPNSATSGGKTNLQPSPSICTAAQNTTALGSATNGDDVVVQMIGFDYPVYQAALGLTQKATPQNPTIANASGQADVTISRAAEQDNGATGAPSPLLRRHAARR